MLTKPTSYEEARNVLKGRPAVSRDAFERLAPEIKPYAFCISGVEDAKMLQRVRDVVAEYAANPHAARWRDAKKEIARELSSLPQFSEEKALRRAELLLRTHGYDALRVGQWELAQETKDTLPYFKYLCTQDERTRRSHRALHGLVLPVDHVFWDKHMPPGWDWNCRCQVVQISERQMNLQKQVEAKLPPERRRVLDERQAKLLAEKGELWVSPTERIFVNSAKKVPSCKSLRMNSEEILKKFDPATREIFLQKLESVPVSGVEGVKNAREWFEGVGLSELLNAGEAAAAGGAKAAKLAVDRDCDLYKKIGEDNYRKMHEILDSATDEIKDMWSKFESEIRILDAKYTRSTAHYSPYYRGINIDIKTDSKERKYETAFSTAFHEIGHNIDSVANERAKNAGGRMGQFSYVYKDDIFGRTLVAEYKMRMKEVADELRAAYKANKDNIQWYNDCGLFSWKELSKTARDWDSGYRPKISLKEIQTAFNRKYFKEEEIENGTTNGLQDIISGVSISKHKLGWGHAAGYWKQDKSNLSAEAFAEMTNASIQNKKTGEMDKIRKIFPESSKIFDEMINKIRSL